MTNVKIKKRGRPSKSELKRRRRAEDRDTVIKFVFYIGIALLLGIFIQELRADQMTHKFKSPSFNGVGTSSHYLTIQNQEFTRKMTIKEEIKALQDEIEREKENSTLARFMRNLESRVYAELSRQLVNNLFGETPSESGTITLEGNTIEYTSDGITLTLKITEADGTVTEITIPIGTFTF